MINKNTAFVRSQRGFALLSSMIAVGLVVTVSAFVLTRTLLVTSKIVNESELWRLELSSEKAIALGGYLVSNSFILCKETGWTGVPEERKCRWANRSEHGVNIDPSRYYLSNPDYNNNGELVMTLNVPDSLGRNYPTILTFQLVNLEEQTDLRKLIGFIPNEASPADDDVFVVHVTAKTEYYTATTSSLYGKGKKYFERQAGIRRPLGMPFLNVTESPTCLYSCVTGMSDTINPQCRGPREIGSAATAGMSLSLKNLGPGPIYNLVYQRTVAYNQIIYPGLAPQVQTFSALAPGQDVLMPGETIARTDTVTCVQPVTVYLPSADSQVATIQTPRGPVTLTRESLTQTFQSLFSYKYDVMVSRYNLSEYASNLDTFFKTYNPFDNKTYIANPTQSKIEPKKSSGVISSSMTSGTSIRLEPPPCDPTYSCCTGSEPICTQQPPIGDGGDGGGGC